MASLRWFSLNGEGNILNFNGNFNVVGDINFVGNLYRNGVLFGDGSGGPDLWDGTFAGGIHYLGPVVGIGTSTPNTAYKLEVQGDVNINGDIYKNGILFTGAGGGASLWSDAGGQLSTTVNVGIGTTNPESQLHIFGTQTSFNASQGIRIGTGSDYATFNYITDPALTEHLMIQSRKSGVDFERNIALNPLGGKVGVGTSEPAYKLDVFGDINFTGDLLKNGVIIGSSAGDAWKSDGPDIYFDEGNIGIGGFPTVYRMAVYGDTNLSISSKYRINEIEVLSETTLGSSVVNSSLTSLGNLTSLTVNTDTLVTSGPNVGIGLANPNYKLDVFGDINITGDLFKEGSLIPLSQWSNFGSSIFYNDGNVGIGLTNPTVALDVVGNSRLIGNVLVGGSINVDSGTLVTSLGNVGVGTSLLPDTLTVSGTASVSRPLRALWTEITIGSSDITSVGFNVISSVYFSSSVSGEFLTSIDGINWSGVSIAAGFIPSSVIYNQTNDKYIAVGTSPGSNPKLYTSPDGLVWTGYVSISSDLRNIAFSSTDFIVACGTNTIVYSSDSLTWTTVSVTGVWNGIVWSSFLNLFVIVGEGGVISTSPDGISWTPQTSGVLTNLLSITSSNDVLVATGVSGILLSSTDSVTWTLETFVNTDTLFKVIWNPVDEIFIIGGQDGKLYSYPPVNEYEIFSNVTEIYAIHHNSNPLSLLVAGLGGNGNFTFGKTLFKVSANLTEVNSVFAVDTDVLFVNSTDNRVGINTDAPTEALDVVGNAVVSGNFAVDTDVLFVNSTDNRVGINTDAPTYSLDVVGNARVTGDFTFGNATMYYKADTTRLGINIAEPTVELDILGKAKITSATGYALEVAGDINFTGGLFQNDIPFVSGGGGGGGDVGDSLPIGAFVRYPWSAPIPDGYLKCDGSEVSRAEYDQLFAVLGEEYGAGDGSTTFLLPVFFDYIIKFRALGATATVDYMPIGSVLTLSWVIDPYPSGWLKCDGAEVSRTEYSQLFAAIGIDYGAGDGSTTFNLPTFFNQGIKYRTTVEAGTGDNAFWILNPDSSLYNITNVGIGTTNPTEKLTVEGNILVSGNVLPGADVTYDIGAPGSAFRDLYLSGDTIFLGITKITTDPVTGSVSFLDKDTSEVRNIVSNNTQNINLNETGDTLIVSGNVGLGTTTPSQKLDIVGSVNLSSGSALKINGSDVITGSGLGIGVTSSSLTSVGTLSSLLVSGNVGLGTTNPSESLHVMGNIVKSGSIYTESFSYTIPQANTGVNSPYFYIGTFGDGDSVSGPIKVRVLSGGNSRFGTSEFEIHKMWSVNPVITFARLGEKFGFLQFSFFSISNNQFALYIRDIVSSTGNITLRVFVETDRLFTNSPPASPTFTILRTDLMIRHNGHVGIGTTNPQHPLQVVGFTLSNTMVAGYLNPTGGTGTATTAWNVSIRASDNVWAGGNVIVSSDSRIKKNVTHIDDGQALTKLRLVEPVEYTYVDEMARGSHRIFGFIAQQVGEHFPEAVVRQKDFIPNVFYKAAPNLDSNTLTVAGKAATGRLRLFTARGTKDLDVTFVDADRVSFPENSLSMEDLIEGYLFVYGYEVDDFHALDTDFLFTINFAATQEIDRQVQAQKMEIEDLKVVNDDLMMQNISLKNRVAELESQMSSLLTALTNRGIL